MVGPATTSRSLDEWYRSVNRIYLDRNYYRDSASIFAHLVEVIGGLSLLASDKKKQKVDPDEFVPKAIAWWMALCGRVGVVSVEALIWGKFPAVCPYCQSRPHDEARCIKIKRAGHPPDWAALAEKGQENGAQHPSTLSGWQRMFYQLYPPSQGEQYAVVFARLAEELGELSEALRAFVVAPAYFLSESADVFAWLMHLRNLRDARAPMLKTLDEAFADAYPDGCRDCGSQVCLCPPVLEDTLGRIAHEALTPLATFKPGGNLISLPEAEQLFRLGVNGVHVGSETIAISRESIKALSAVLPGIRDIVEASLAPQRADIARVLAQLDDASSSGRVMQAQLDALANALRDVPGPQRDLVVDFLNGLSSNVWAAAILQVISTAVR